MFTKFAVRANPVQGHDYRRRAGRAWGRDKIEVELVDRVTDPLTQISNAQLIELREDPHIVIVPVGEGGEGPTTEDVVALKAEIARLEELVSKQGNELAKLRTVQPSMPNGKPAGRGKQ